MDIANAKFFVWHDLNNGIIYTSKSLEPIQARNRFFPISVYGVVPTESGDKMISVELGFQQTPVLIGGIMGTFVHWEYFDKMYHLTKRIEL